MRSVLRFTRIWLVSGALLAGFGLLDIRAQTFDDLLQQGYTVRHAVVPIYTGSPRRLAAQIRFDKTSTDYQRRGFFQIGAFPITVLEGVDFELPDEASLTNSLAHIHHWLKNGADMVELRRARLLIRGESTPRIEAGRVKILADRWELSGGVRSLSGGAETRAATATLWLNGKLDFPKTN